MRMVVRNAEKLLLEPARGAESGSTARTGTRREIGQRNDDEKGPDERLVNETTTEKTRREIGQRNDDGGTDERLVNETTTRKIRREIGQRNDDEEYPTRDWTTKRPRREHDF